MTVKKTAFVYLDQDDIQTAILDYVNKVQPDLKPAGDLKFTLGEGWKMTVSCEIKD